MLNQEAQFVKKSVGKGIGVCKKVIVKFFCANQKKRGKVNRYLQ